MYLVCIRQIFRDALDVYNDYDEGIIRITTNPWRKVSIPKADTPEKRAITLEECRQFFSASLPESDRINPLPELGRDVALMTLCLAGINSVDLYNLKKENYHDGIICYERAKTRKARTDNAYIEMRVPDMLKPVFEKYLDKSDSEYMEVVKDEPIDEYRVKYFHFISKNKYDKHKKFILGASRKVKSIRIKNILIKWLFCV